MCPFLQSVRVSKHPHVPAHMYFGISAMCRSLDHVQWAVCVGDKECGREREHVRKKGSRYICAYEFGGNLHVSSSICK